MLNRNSIVTEVWKRVAGIPNIIYTARNPSRPPTEDEFPCIQIFEREDKISSSSRSRTQKPINKRELLIYIEVFTKADTDESASHDLSVLVDTVKSALYVDGSSLGGRCDLHEVEMSPIVRPTTGTPSVGISIALKITYVEEII